MIIKNDASPIDASARDREFFEKAFIASPTPCVLLDKATSRIMRVNAAWVRLFGFTAEEAVGRTPVELGMYRSEEERTETLKRLAGPVPTVRDVTVFAKGGEPRILDFSIQEIEVDGRVSRFAQVRDVTEERRRGRALEIAGRRFEKIFNTSPNACVIVDEHGRVTSANTSWLSLFGVTAAETVGRTLRELAVYVSEDDRRAVDARFAADGKVRDYEAEVRLKNGDVRLASVSCENFEVDGERSVMVIFRDITKLKEAARALEEQADELRRSNRELEQFAYVSSHDLKEPLRKVANYAQLLASTLDGQLGPDHKRYLQHIGDGVQRMNRLIEDLLSYSRIGREKPSRERVDLGAVARQVRRDMDETIRAKGARLHFNGLPTINAVPSEMQQLMQNLVGNALKFSRDGVAPEVWITSEPEGEGWALSVRDNGIGIDPKYFGSIFGVFQRLHSRQAYPGNGIGLAICKKIAERHGGSIAISSAPGEGTTFRVSLP